MGYNPDERDQGRRVRAGSVQHRLDETTRMTTEARARLRWRTTTRPEPDECGQLRGRNAARARSFMYIPPCTPRFACCCTRRPFRPLSIRQLGCDAPFGPADKGLCLSAARRRHLAVVDQSDGWLAALTGGPERARFRLANCGCALTLMG